jgi:hypothetical protein
MADINFALSALGSVATANSEAAGYPPANANDGNDLSLWRKTAQTGGNYLALDLGAPVYITRIELLGWRSQTSTTWSVQASDDGVNWNTITTQASTSTPTDYSITLGDGLTARYWRFYQASSQSTCECKEFQAWGPTAGPPPVNAPACDEIELWLDGLEAYWVPCVQTWLDSQ